MGTLMLVMEGQVLVVLVIMVVVFFILTVSIMEIKKFQK